MQGITSLLKGELDERDMKVYRKVQLVGFDQALADTSGLQLAVRFETLRRVKKWEANPGLMYGNLVCLSPGGRFQQASRAFLLEKIPSQQKEVFLGQHLSFIL